MRTRRGVSLVGAETVQVDYAGDTVVVVDDGTARAAQIFVACLPGSGRIHPAGQLDPGDGGLAWRACPSVCLPGRRVTEVSAPWLRLRRIPGLPSM